MGAPLNKSKGVLLGDNNRIFAMITLQRLHV
jgi:hypothetical protein